MITLRRIVFWNQASTTEQLANFSLAPSDGKYLAWNKTNPYGHTRGACCSCDCEHESMHSGAGGWQGRAGQGRRVIEADESTVANYSEGQSEQVFQDHSNFRTLSALGGSSNGLLSCCSRPSP
jgi:hypothetical protein